MSALLLSALAAGSSGQGALYVDDVFSAYPYTGNGSTQTINNGIDLAGNGGLVWIKIRGFLNPHLLYDTSRGYDKRLSSNTTNAQSSKTQELTSFNSTGFSLGNGEPNLGGYQFISWTFRKAPKFFDVVTYTGNGASNRTLSHQLNADVGMIAVKATSTTGDWWVFHRGATGDLVLNTTAAQTASKANIPSATTSTFTVNGSANTNGVTYVAYLWAHDPSTEGIIQCGSFTTDASGNATVNLGWEPQFGIVKASSTTSDWIMLDSMRGWNMSANDATLLANTSGAETVATERGNPTATGFDFKGGAASQTYIYLAIRRPNKPPTSGTEVFQARTRSGTGSATTYSANITVDSLWTAFRAETYGGLVTTYDRLRGNRRNLTTSSAGAENNVFSDSDPQVDFVGTHTQTMVSFPSEDWNNLGQNFVDWIFKRAHGFMDVVCYTGTGVARTVSHNLGVAPELMIVKDRSAATQWEVFSSALANTEKLALNSTAGKATDATAWNSTAPTATQFSVGTGANVNTNAATYVTYLFATLAGISKVGSYTGNGSSQTINCGFSTGARFILIKRTDATGDWYVWDSVRGIVAANDPHLSLNTTAAEVTTDDSVDPDASGFIVNQNTATNINVNGGQYIFLAIA